MKATTLTCPDISCQHCVMTIKRELAGLTGVTVEAIDLDAKQVRLQVSSDEDLSLAIKTLVEIGYPPAG
ncbi:MAG: heavy-metal-associated domain-containing protein [Chloroflexi bacterium]|nr:heavy-metal-associated domain-containing protein [Chloroflexota bacterium]